jgi:hypothetical protein
MAYSNNASCQLHCHGDWRISERSETKQWNFWLTDVATGKKKMSAERWWNGADREMVMSWEVNVELEVCSAKFHVEWPRIELRPQP